MKKIARINTTFQYMSMPYGVLLLLGIDH